MYVHDYMAGGLNLVMDSNTREARKLLWVRRLSSVTWETAENDVEVVSFMMAGARKRGRECPGKDDGNDKTPKKPRQQKQPHGNGQRQGEDPCVRGWPTSAWSTQIEATDIKEKGRSTKK